MQPSASELLALRARESTYPGTAENVSTVRADLRPLLHDCPAADEVILCASELAANAVLHSNTRLPGGTFTVDELTHHVRPRVAPPAHAAFCAAISPGVAPGSPLWPVGEVAMRWSGYPVPSSEEPPAPG